MSSKTLSKRRVRGFTLIELMMVAAIGMVVLAAAFIMLDVLNIVQEKTERKMEVISELNIGTQRQTRVLENAGANFKSARLGFRVTRTLPGISYWDGSALQSYAPVSRTATGIGFIQESDVLDVWEGSDPLREHRAGEVESVPSIAGYQGTLQLKDVDMAPVLLADAGTSNPAVGTLFTTYQAPNYLLFNGSSASGNVSCLARLIDAAGVTRRVIIEHVLIGDGPMGSPNLYSAGDSPTAPTFTGTDFTALSTEVGPSPGLRACPSQGMQVYAVSKRRLYAVLRTQTSGRPSLYEFEFDFANNRFNEPALISVGVDDFGVSPFISVALGQSQLVTDGGAIASDWPYTGGTALTSSQIVGAEIRYVSRGAVDRQLSSVFADGGSAIGFADGTYPTDGLLRELRTSDLAFMNFNPNLGVDVDP